jgi:hypothetical protein
MSALSTDALLVILVVSTLAMLATWSLSHRRGNAARRLSVIACAFFAGTSIGTSVALAARTPWLWSFLRVPHAVRSAAVASGRVTPALLPAMPPTEALPQQTAALQEPNTASPPSRTNSAPAGRVDGRDQRFKAPAVSPDRPLSTWERRGGTVVAVDEQALTIEEMGPWTGTSTRPTRTSITMTSETRIALVERSHGTSAQDQQGSFRASPLARSALRVGDYVTVTTQSAEGRHVATSITVVRASESRPDSKPPSGANATPGDPGVQAQARRSGDTVSPRLSGEPVSVPPSMPTEPARPRAGGVPEDGSAVIDWLLQR